MDTTTQDGILNRKKRALLKKSCMFKGEWFKRRLKKILENPITVGSINSLNIERLEFLLTSENTIELQFKILQYPNAIGGFNSMQIEKLNLLMTKTNVEYPDDFIELLVSYDKVNSVDDGKFKLIIDTDFKLLLKRYEVLDIINTMEYEKLDCLIRRGKYLHSISAFEIGEMLKCKIIMESLNSMIIERLKLVLEATCDNDELMYLLLDKSDAIKGLNCMHIEKLKAFVANITKNYQFHLLIDLLINHDMINTVESDKFNLIVNKHSSNYHVFLKRQYVDVINKMDKEKLQLVLRNDWFSQSLQKILGNQNLVTQIELFDIERMKLFYTKSSKFDIPNVLPLIIKNRNVSVINRLNFEKLSIILNSPRIRCNARLELLQYLDTTGADLINDIDMEKFKLLLDVDNEGDDNDGDTVWTEVVVDGKCRSPKKKMLSLKDHDFVDAINLFDIEKYRLLVAASHRDLIMEILRNQDTVNSINSMSIERLSTLLHSNKIPRCGKIKLLYTPETIATLNTIDIEKLKLFLDVGIVTMEDEDIDMDVEEENFRLSNSSDKWETCFQGEIRSIAVDEDSDVDNDNARFSEFLEDDDNANLIMFMDDGGSSDSENEMNNNATFLCFRGPDTDFNIDGARLLGESSFANSLNSIEIRRFKLLLLKHEEIVIRILNNQNMVTAINLLNFQTLKSAINVMNANDLLSVLENLHLPELRINLNLAIALYRAGFIRHVTYNSLQNKNGVYAKVCEIFPEKFPIDQILEKSNIINEGNVLNLKYLSLSFVIEKYDKSTD